MIFGRRQVKTRLPRVLNLSIFLFTFISVHEARDDQHVADQADEGDTYEDVDVEG